MALYNFRGTLQVFAFTCARAFRVQEFYCPAVMHNLSRR